MQSKPIETSPELLRLLKEAKNHVITPREKWLQRVSFVYGNASLDNPRITREMVEKSAIEEYGPCPDE